MYTARDVRLLLYNMIVDGGRRRTETYEVRVEAPFSGLLVTFSGKTGVLVCCACGGR